MNARVANLASCDVPLATPASVTAATATEMHRLGLARLVDIRQAFEREIRGNLPNAIHIPLFNVKQFFNFKLDASGQAKLDVTGQAQLDADKPNDLDTYSFIKAISTMRQGQDAGVLLLVCNDSQRSLNASRLLRERGYERVFAVQGGFLALKHCLAGQEGNL